MVYSEITRDIRVEVEPAFVPEHSAPADQYFFFSYRVRITNQGEKPAQLVRRHWTITDGKGKIHQVDGEGVVGQKPKLEPGETFEYSSFCPLPTPTGNMRGNYRMLSDGGEEFAIRIPLFFLRDLRQVH